MIRRFLDRGFVGLAVVVLVSCSLYSVPQYDGTATKRDPAPTVSEQSTTEVDTPSQADETLSSEETFNTTQVFLPTVSVADETALPTSGGEYFVAPNGRADGDGSINRPWDLKTAISKVDAVYPGSIIWLRGGTYSNGGETFNCKLRGTKDNPIILRQYPGEQAILEDSLYGYGAYTWFWGFAVTSTQPRTLPDDLRYLRGPGIGLYGPGYKAINVVIYNAGHPGISFGEEVVDGEIYGAILWGNGMYQDGLIRGSGIYAQNKDDTRLISDVISFRNFTTGMKTWSQTGGHGNGFRFEGNISFDNGDRNIFAGSSEYPLNELSLLNNYTYRKEGDTRIGVQLGYDNALQNQNLLVKDNYLVSGSREVDNGSLTLSGWISGLVENNTIISRNLIAAYYEPATSTGKAEFKSNAFHGLLDKFWYQYPSFGYDYLKFAEWQTMIGFDQSNNFHPYLPAETKVFIRPNSYEPGRAHIVVYNWLMRDRMSIDLSSVLSEGQNYRIVDAQNYFGSPVASGSFNGGLIEIPMNLLDVSPITDVTHLENVHTPKEFNVFVLTVEP